MTHLEAAQPKRSGDQSSRALGEFNGAEALNDLQWFTTRISSLSDHLIHIRDGRSRSPESILYLDRAQSKLLTAILNELADDQTIPWTGARLAVLKAFWKALHASS